MFHPGFGTFCSNDDTHYQNRPSKLSDGGGRSSISSATTTFTGRRCVAFICFLLAEVTGSDLAWNHTWNYRNLSALLKTSLPARLSHIGFEPRVPHGNRFAR